MTQALVWTVAGTGFTALMTTAGAAMVFLFRRPASSVLHRIMLGFAGGVMIAASMWSLLIPAIEQSEASGTPGWLPAGGGVTLGILFLLAAERLLPLPAHAALPGRRAAVLVLAVTLHNIPEGMAIGISFSLAAKSGEPALLASAAALAIGIGIQNFPEGAAISLPLRQEGMRRSRAFLTGALSGLVEPLFGAATVLAVGTVQPALPWLLSFAAGAMLFVVVEELIPEASGNKDGHHGTLGVMAGFLLMMLLDVALG